MQMQLYHCSPPPNVIVVVFLGADTYPIVFPKILEFPKWFPVVSVCESCPRLVYQRKRLRLPSFVCNRDIKDKDRNIETKLIEHMTWINQFHLGGNRK